MYQDPNPQRLAEGAERGILWHGVGFKAIDLESEVR